MGKFFVSDSAKIGDVVAPVENEPSFFGHEHASHEHFCNDVRLYNSLKIFETRLRITWVDEYREEDRRLVFSDA